MVDVVSVQDVPGSNISGLGDDELIFADGTVTSVGQIIALVLAVDQPAAQRGVKSVVVTYTDLPAVITIEVCVCEREGGGREGERERRIIATIFIGC